MPQTPGKSAQLPGSLMAGSPGEIAELLRLILAQAGQGIFVVNNSGQAVFANEIAIQLMGVVDSAPGDANWSEYYGLHLPDTKTLYPPHQTPLHRALRGETVDDCEMFVRNQIVPGRWVSTTTRPLRGRDGEIWGAVAVLRDITAEKSAEKTLKESERPFRKLFEGSRIGQVLSTAEGAILDCNEEFANIVGYSRTDLLGMHAGELYFEADVRERILNSMLANGSESDLETVLRHSSGRPVYVLGNMRLVDDPESGIQGGILSAVVDVTERKRQEWALRESELRFAAFMGSLPGGAFIKGLDLRYVYYNQAAAFWEMAGKPEIGFVDADIFPKDVAERLERVDRRVVREGIRVDHMETVRIDGVDRTFMATKFPILDGSGRPHLIGGIIVDITERRRLEEQLRLSQKMEAIGRLAGGVAHDFNNLLTIIAGYAHMLEDGIVQGKSSTLYPEFAREIVKASDRAALLTGQLLVFSRRQVTQPVVLDLRNIVQSLDKMLRRTLGENIEISLEIPDGPCHVKADASQMEQLVLNLALRARDAMPTGGNLQIRVFEDSRPSGSMVVLECNDSGKPMDASARERVFEPYFSAEKPTKFGGLELSTVYGIVKQNGGEIEVSSAEGAGSTFRVLLPVAVPSDEIVVPKAPRVKTRKRTGTILLAEDEEGVRQLVSKMLHTQGYNVYEAANGAEAIQLFEQHGEEIQLLLTDVIMPKMSGRELAERLTAQAPMLKVVYMSGYTDDILAREGLVYESTVLLQKPFTLNGLAKTLNAVLD